MVALRDLTRLGDDLDRLAGALGDLRLPTQLSSLGPERDRLAGTIRDYLIPRVSDPESPLTVVFAGPTGSGKSTLINSLTGLELSVAGPLRPTTTAPVVLANEHRAAGSGEVAGIPCRVVSGSAPILEAMVLIDTPDIDSTSTDHRRMAETLIDNADVVVFVTSALRYADAVPWQVLRRAESRGADVIHVLNRVGSSTRGAVFDFQARLRSAGLSDGITTVPEHRVAAQILPSVAVRALRRQLTSLASSRATTIERAFDRVLHSTLRDVEALQARLEEAVDSWDSMREDMVNELVARADSLDLSGAAGRLHERPTGETGREARRWRRTARRGSVTNAEADEVAASLETRLVRDLRLWLADTPNTVMEPVVGPGQLLSGIVPIAGLALEGWIDFVRRIAREEEPRSVGLAESVLIESATDPREVSSARLLFGDRADELVGRARRELKSRLEVIYEQAAAHAAELVELEVGNVDAGEIRSALAAVTSTLAPVDA